MRHLWLAAVAVCLGCVSQVPRTQVIVEIDAEPGIRADLRELRVRVLGGPAGALDQTTMQTLTQAEVRWPVVVAIVPTGGDATRRFELTATAQGATGAIGTVRVASGFQPRRTVLIRLLLEDCCRNQVCSADQTCSQCRCVASAKDPATLPDFMEDGGASFSETGPRDANPADAPRDAGNGRELGVDQGGIPTPDGGPDAGTLVDAAGDLGAPVDVGPGDTGPVDTGPVAPPDTGPVACVSPMAECDGNPATICETNTTSSPQHCGGCGLPCSNNNGVSACVSSQCMVVTCNAPFRDCVNGVSDLCETNTDSSLDHCGQCGQSCRLFAANSSCNTGTCALTSCQPGYGNCDGRLDNGCESNLQTTGIGGYCGNCQTQCAAAERCSQGRCCPQGFDWCGNGCFDLASDRNHCGSCTMVCGGGLRCFDYECVP